MGYCELTDYALEEIKLASDKYETGSTDGCCFSSVYSSTTAITTALAPYTHFGNCCYEQRLIVLLRLSFGKEQSCCFVIKPFGRITVTGCTTTTDSQQSFAKSKVPPA